MGGVAREYITLSKTITTTAGAYSANDNVGNLFKLKGADLSQHNQAKIVGIRLYDKGKQSADTDVIFYKSKPAGTFTDNVAQTITDADMVLISHVENLTAYDSFVANSLAGATGLNVAITFTDGIYVSLVTRGTPTYASTTDLVLEVTIEQAVV